jgi:Spy/CpxP family protein refolding chaperone
MGGVLEVGKLVTASWLYRNWRETPFLLKSYLTTAVAVLMLITSMGIFGFLSKAHIDQGIGSNDATAKIERLDTAISRNRREMERAQRTLDSFDQAQGRYTSLGYVTRGLAAREEQKEEREAMRNIIAEAEAENDKLYDQRSELASEVRAFEVEVGPIKYIAELIYGESDGNLEQAVRAVILLLIFVFDP